MRSRIHQSSAVVRGRGRAEQAISLGLDPDLDEACGLADAHGSAFPLHVEPGGLGPAAGLALGALGHADAPHSVSIPSRAYRCVT